MEIQCKRPKMARKNIASRHLAGIQQKSTTPCIGVARTFRLGGGKLFFAKFEVKILLFRRDAGAEDDFC